MTSLLDLLPPPTDGFVLKERDVPQADELTVVPAQPTTAAGVSRVLTLPTKHNHPDYTAIVKQGENASRTVFATHDSILKRPNQVRPLPSKEDVEATARRTRAALEAVIAGKLATKSTETDDKPSFIRYTPANTNAEDNKQRIVKLVEAPVDPMEPPRHAHRKAPVNPPSPPVPVLHSPERKPTKQEAAEWKIPPVVSKWKNNRGYTISLDKRLAADGRGMIDHSINDRFAHFAEAMYTAERDARSEVEQRAKLQRQVNARAKEARQRELRELAERARRERKGYLGLDVESSVAPSDFGAPSEIGGLSEYAAESDREARPVADDAPPTMGVRRMDPPKRPRHARDDDSDADSEVRRRDMIRAERRKMRERELRGREVHGDDSTRATLRRSKLTRDADRDVGERVALGQEVARAGSGEVMYDQRLFNQDGGAMRKGTSLAGGYGADDAYNLYDRPLFKGSNSVAKFQYRGSGATDVDERERRFQADRGFAGAQKGDGEAQKPERRDRPVEFEKDNELRSSANNDPYGLDKFLNEAKTK